MTSFFVPSPPCSPTGNESVSNSDSYHLNTKMTRNLSHLDKKPTISHRLSGHPDPKRLNSYYPAEFAALLNTTMTVPPPCELS